MTENPDYKALVIALPSWWDAAAHSAMENAYDLGHREESEDFWREVWGQLECQQ